MASRRKTSVSKLKRPPIKESLAPGADGILETGEIDLQNALKDKDENIVIVQTDSKPIKRTKNRQTEIPTVNNEERPVKKARQTIAVAAAGKVSSTKSRKVKLSIQDYAPKEKSDLILTCGDGDAGQLGLGSDSTSCKRPKVIQNFSPNVFGGFLQAIAGGMHTVVLTADYEVYTCGCNDEGALGRECYADDGVTIPDDDQDYTLRKVTFDPKLLETHGKIVQISAGDTHCAALTEKGSVFIWGTFRDKGGCLGISLNDNKHGVIVKNVRPVLLSSFKERQVVKIACGFNHLALLSSDGCISTVGAGDAGQLGRLAPQFRDSSVSHRTKRRAVF